MQPYRDVRARAALDTPTAWATRADSVDTPRSAATRADGVDTPRFAATRADSALGELCVVELLFNKQIEEKTIDFSTFRELFRKNVEGAFDGHCFLIRAVLCR